MKTVSPSAAQWLWIRAKSSPLLSNLMPQTVRAFYAFLLGVPTPKSLKDLSLVHLANLKNVLLGMPNDEVERAVLEFLSKKIPQKQNRERIR